jgi:hypothetical protein
MLDFKELKTSMHTLAVQCEADASPFTSNIMKSVSAPILPMAATPALHN